MRGNLSCGRHVHSGRQCQHPRGYQFGIRAVDRQYVSGCSPPLGHEFLDARIGRDGQRVDLQLQRQQATRVQADPSAESLDQRLRPVCHHADDRQEDCRRERTRKLGIAQGRDSPYDDLRNGAVIDFDLAATPDTVRGTSEASRPYSFSNEKALPSAKKKK